MARPSPDTRDRLQGRGPEKFTRSKQYSRIATKNRQRAAARKVPKSKPNAPARRSTVGGRSPAYRGGGGGGGGFRGGGGGGGGGRVRGGGGGGGMKLLDAAKFAQTLTDLEFGPQIDELEYQIGLGKEQREQNLADIESWYDTVDQEIDDVAVANALAAQQGQEDYEGAVSGIAAAFGGGANLAAQEMAAYTVGQRGLLENLEQSQRAYDQDLGAIAEQQEVDAKTWEGRYQDQQARDLARQLTQTKAQRGRALTVNRFQAEEQRMQQQAAIQNMRLAEQMSGIEMASAVANLKSTQLSNQMKAIQVADLKKQIKGGGGGGAIPPFSQIDPGTRSQVEERLRAGTTGERGGLTHRPDQVLNEMGRALRILGWDPRKDRGAKTFRDTLLRDALLTAHRVGNFRNWRIVNNRLVSPTGKVIYRFF